MKHKKQKIALVAIMLLVFIGGTFAYFSNELVTHKTLKTKAYSSELIDKFTPKNNWEPGETVEKVVSVENKGDYKVLVRVALSEEWKRNSETVMELDAKKATGEASQVEKDLATEGWLFNKEDGYWYYKSLLNPKEKTNELLKSITLKADADMGTYKAVRYYTTEDKEPSKNSDQWIKLEEGQNMPAEATYSMVKTEIDSKGYTDAKYTLKVKAQILQATKDAVDGLWGESVPLEIKNLAE